MAQLTDGFKDIFLAGIGAMAITGEKAKEVVDQLIERGELTVEQGKQVSGELAHKATAQADKVGASVLEATMGAMSAEKRAEFVQRVAAIAADIEAKEAEKAAADEAAQTAADEGDPADEGGAA